VKSTVLAVRELSNRDLWAAETTDTALKPLTKERYARGRLPNGHHQSIPTRTKLLQSTCQ